MQKKTKRLFAVLGFTFLGSGIAWSTYNIFVDLIIIGEALDKIIGGVLFVAAIVFFSLLLPKKLRIVIRVFGFVGVGLLIMTGIMELLGLRTIFPGLELSVLMAIPPLLALLPFSFVRFKKSSRRNILSAVLAILGAALLAAYPFYLFVTSISYRTPNGIYTSPDGRNRLAVFYPSQNWIDPYSSVYAIRFGIFTVEEDSVFAEERYRPLQFGEAVCISDENIHWESNDSVTITGRVWEFGECTYRIRFDAGSREKNQEYVPKEEVSP